MRQRVGKTGREQALQPTGSAPRSSASLRVEQEAGTHLTKGTRNEMKGGGGYRVSCGRNSLLSTAVGFSKSVTTLLHPFPSEPKLILSISFQKYQDKNKNLSQKNEQQVPNEQVTFQWHNASVPGISANSAFTPLRHTQV